MTANFAFFAAAENDKHIALENSIEENTYPANDNWGRLA
jgi:hypothetical protein